jgi:aryl-alcohol dehydrogenase-like predicted oxidoreductase
MITRREYLKLSLAAGVTLAAGPAMLFANPARRGELMTRAIPSSGQRIPVVGLGSSATFAQVARSEDVSALREVFAAMLEHGGAVFDTAPAYGASEEVAGQLAKELGATDRIFWATKLNVAQGPGGSADAQAAREQLRQSFERIGKDPLDLVQVHSLGDIPTQLPILKEAKEAGRLRYVGVTTTSAGQYDQLIDLMRRERLDFIGIDYAVDNRNVEEHILPLAQERGTAVMVYMPFGRTRLWSRVNGRDVPDWAAEFGASSWAQFFLKFALSHPAVTVVTPATSRATNMVDNMGAAYGALPDDTTRARMIAYVDALPAAQAPAPPTPTHAVELPAAVLDRYVGEYEFPTGMTLTVRREGVGLAAGPTGQEEIALSTLSETRFAIPGGPQGIEFQLDGEGTVTGLLLDQPTGQPIQATRKR